MEYFAGLDISMDETHVCVVDREGTLVTEEKTASTPEAIAASLAKARACRRIVFETGRMAPMLYHGLAAFGLRVVCIESRQAYQALKSLATEPALRAHNRAARRLHRPKGRNGPDGRLRITDSGAWAPRFSSVRNALATQAKKEKRADGKPRPIKCEGHGPPEGNSCGGGTGRSRHVHQLKSVCTNIHHAAPNFCAVQLCVRGFDGCNLSRWHFHSGALFMRTLPSDQRRFPQPVPRGHLIKYECRNICPRDRATMESI
jgi:hypothetical protein